MKKSSIIVMSISLVFLLVHGYLAYASNYAKKQSTYKEVVDELLSTRTSIMNQALYHSEDLNTVFLGLEKIESEKLIKEDIDSLLHARANPTDFPFISGLEVLNVELLELKDNVYKLKALIQWEVIEAGEVKIDVEYFIHMKQENGKFLLTSLVPVR